VTKADGLFNQIFEVLQKICPYSYEVIGLLVNRMKESCATEKDQQIVSDCYVVLKFLNLFNRQNGFTAQELKWYKNFMKDSIQEVGFLCQYYFSYFLSILGSYSNTGTFGNIHARD
jgi:hypothetical protein